MDGGSAALATAAEELSNMDNLLTEHGHWVMAY